MDALLVLLILMACSGGPEIEPAQEAGGPSAARPEAAGDARRLKGSEDLYPEGEFFRHMQRLRISGEAAAALDVNGDERIDLVVVDGTRSFAVLGNSGRVEPGQLFMAKRRRVGPKGTGWSFSAKGLGLHDLDNDGLLDLYLSVALKNNAPQINEWKAPAGGYSTQLNNGDGTFRRTDFGIDSAGYKRTALFSDLDRDGFTDVYVSNSAYYGRAWVGKGEPNILVNGTENGFGVEQLAAMSSPKSDFWVGEDGRTRKNFKGAVIRDFDGDGLGDIVTGSLSDLWAKSRYELTNETDPGYQGTWDRGVYVFHNRSTPGHLDFADISHEAISNAYGTTDQPHVHAVVPGDYDLDGDFDLILSGYKGINGHNTLEHNTAILRYFENVSTPGKLRFKERTEQAGFASMNEAEGLPGPYPVRYHHHGVDVVLYPSLLAGAALDIDNDGDLDFVATDRQVTRRNPETQERLNLHSWVFLNDGRGQFERVEAERSGLWGTARDLSYGDFNQDGKLDLVVVDGSGGGQFVSNATDVFLNQHDNQNRFIGLKVSLPEDSFGIGTLARVLEPATGKLLGYDELRTDFCYRSKRDARLHFGVGKTEKVDLALRLNDGRELRFDGLETNGVYRVLVRDWDFDSETGVLQIISTEADKLLTTELQDVWMGEEQLPKLRRAEVSGDDLEDWVVELGKEASLGGATLYASGEGLKVLFVPQHPESEGR